MRENNNCRPFGQQRKGLRDFPSPKDLSALISRVAACSSANLPDAPPQQSCQWKANTPPVEFCALLALVLSLPNLKGRHGKQRWSDLIKVRSVPCIDPPVQSCTDRLRFRTATVEKSKEENS
jgi:hypothetical protein